MNLRQFDLAQRNRGTRALRDGVRQFRRPHWRPVRFGLAALVIAQIVGLNLWAWNQRATIDHRRDEVQRLVKATFPRLSDNEIRMAPMLVMQREVNAELNIK